MTICSNCRFEQPSSEVTTCIQCGYPIERTSDVDDVSGGESPLGFYATEAKEDDREFVGASGSGRHRGDDDLGIESTSDLMEQEAARRPDDDTSRTGHFTPIGESAPPPPPTPFEEYPTESFAPPPEETSKELESTDDDDDPQRVKKLSEEEIKRIEQNLYGSKSFIKGEEQQELIKKVDSMRKEAEAADDDAGSSETPPSMPNFPGAKPRSAASRKARKGQGIAYFYRNYIQIKGNHTLITNDILKINDREYTLRPKKLGTGLVIGSSAVALVLILIVVTALLTSGNSSGEGRLIGVLLDQSNQPYIRGAEVRLPESGRTVESDARGYFDAGFLPVGSHKIEYIINGQVVQVEHASVTSGDIRMVFLRPSDEEIAASEYGAVQTPVRETQPQRPAEKAAPVVAKAPEKTTTSKSSTQTSSKTSTTTTSRYAKITLDANVDGAKLVLDGSVLGAGNLTYSRISTGKHNYRVSADGYNPVEGSLSLTGGEDRRLAVTLTPMKQAQKVAEYNVDDFFHSGRSALSDGDFATAVADLSNAIEKKPSHAEAYYYRAEAYQNQKRYRDAHDDYVRAAEIYQIRKDYSKSVQAYTKATECDEKSVTAFVGRGNAYLKKGEMLAAIADFDKAMRLDKRCFEAYYGMGEARFKQQQYKKAIDDFKDARSINSKNPLVHQYLMLSYMALSDYDNVKKSYDKFVDIASEEQLNRFRTDQRYSAVVRVVDSH